MTRIQGVPDLGPGLRLHLNENTGGCSPKVVEVVRSFGATGLATYPDYRAAVLEAAAFFHVDPDWLVLTNGLDEGILLTAVACLARGESDPVPEVVMPMPAFDPYITTAKAMRARIHAVAPERDYGFPERAVLAAITANTRLIYINNPNNPTGQMVVQDSIRRVARAAPHAIVFVDEAYYEFMGQSFLDDAATLPNVLIGRTFSKAHGLAGMRVGVMIARPEVLEPIRFVMPIFNLNVVAVQALRAAIRDTEFTPWYVAQVTAAKERLYAALDRVGLRYWRSAANFVLVDGGTDARAIVDGMIERGVLVRDRTQDPYCPNCFRITAGLVEHADRAVAALESVCAKR
jgi:histidinol-phosphate aminotransferase